MIKRFILLVVLLAPIRLSGADLLFSSEDTPAGMNTTDFPSKISDANVSDCLNVWLNKGSGQRKKDGLSDIGGCYSTSSNGLWSFFSQNLDEWLIRLDCRGNLIAGRSIGSSGSCFSVCVTTNQVSTEEPTDSTNCLGKQWFTNKEDPLMSWDGTTTVQYPNAPKAARIGCHKNRVVLADITNEQSSVRFSGEQNGGDWTNDSRFSTSPVTFAIGGANAGDKVFDIHSSNNELIVFLRNAMWGILGNDQRDFQTRLISNSIGCQFPDTISEKANILYFLSNRGVEAYNVAANAFTSPPLSDPVDDFFNPLIKAGRSGRNKSWTSAADWQSGTSSPLGNITATVNPGSIQPNNNTFTDTVQADWDQGTYFSSGSILTSSGTPGSLVFTSTTQAQIQNGSFETAGIVSSTEALNWTIVGRDSSGENTKMRRVNPGNLSAHNGSLVLAQDMGKTDGVDTIASTTTILRIVNENDVVLAEQAFSVATIVTWQKMELNTTAFNGATGKVQLLAKQVINPGPSEEVLESTATSQVITFSTSVTAYQIARTSANLGSVQFDSVFVPARPLSIFPAHYVSRAFNTQVAIPNYGPIRATLAIGTITIGIETSTDGLNWGTQVVTASGSVPANERQQYIRYTSSFSVIPTTSVQTIQVNDITLASWVTGYHQTAAIDVGLNISSWGLFSADHALNDGTIAYQLQSSTSIVFNEQGWVNQGLDQTIGVGVNRFIAARVVMRSNASTATPVTASLSFNWDEGSDPPAPIGIVYQNDYHIFLTSNTGTSPKNDLHLIFEDDRGFTKHGGYRISAAAIQGNRLVLGDADETGRVFEMESSTNGRDRGQEFESFVKFKRVDGAVPGQGRGVDVALAEKTLSHGYLTISREDSTQSQFFDVKYSIDGATTTYSAATVEISTGNHLTFGKFFVPQDNPSIQIQGRYFDFTVQEKNSDLGYTIQSFKLYGNILPIE